MSIQKVRDYFKPFGIEDRIREFDVSSATVELAAVAVGVEGARIAKSMSFKVGDEPIIIVVAGDAKVDNSRYKAQFHTKAKMLTFEEAHTMIGHDPGGVCSFLVDFLLFFTCLTKDHSPCHIRTISTIDPPKIHCNKISIFQFLLIRNRMRHRLSLIHI